MARQHERGATSRLLEGALPRSRTGLHGERWPDLIRRTAVVRTRMPGGVGGAASRDAPLSRLRAVVRAATITAGLGRKNRRTVDFPLDLKSKRSVRDALMVRAARSGWAGAGGNWGLRGRHRPCGKRDDGPPVHGNGNGTEAGAATGVVAGTVSSGGMRFAFPPYAPRIAPAGWKSDGIGGAPPALALE